MDAWFYQHAYGHLIRDDSQLTSIVHGHSLGANISLLGLIEGLAESTSLLIKVFSGAISDYLGKCKALAIFGYGLGAFTKPLFSIGASVDVVITARML